ncbi:zinc ribbon domain-containing protein [Candidatus Fermentibacteria bacterium]|nr:zinc ribbon domain-containing protein [Candidatus Fermentibacteria bacterium]
MPTYEYRCTACGHTFEIFQPITAPALTQCPRCSGVVERLLGTGAAVIFKGSGFYATDHRSEDYKKKVKEESGTGISKTESSKSGPSKSETACAANTPESSSSKD